MNLDKLLAMAQTKAQLKKAWNDTRNDLLMMTITRLTTPETLDTEIQKSLDEFIAKQLVADEFSRGISTKLAQGVKEEIMEMLSNPQEGSLEAYELTIPH